METAGSAPYKFLCAFSSNQTTAWKEMPVGVLVGNTFFDRTLLLFLAGKVQLVVLVSAFVMVSTLQFGQFLQ